MAKKKNGVDYWLNRVLGVFLSEDRIRFYLLGIFILGFVLRLIGAMNLGVSADDMHFSVHAINFLSSGKLVTYDQSASLWYYVTDVFYRMFGLSQLTSRMAPLLFGSFSIFIIFFLANEFFGKKAGLVAAFLLAISPYHIKYTISEMDIMAMFFVLFALLLFVWALKENKSRFFAFSGVLLGLAILTKVYTLLFIPVLLVYALYFNKKEKKKLIDKKLAGKLFYFLIVAFLFAIPSLTHNYLLYKDKGFVDLIYTNALGIGKNVSAQYYSWDSGWGMGADWHGFFLGNSIHMGGDPLPSSLYPFEFILYNDPIALIFGILGLAFLLFRKRWEYPLLFLFVLVFVFSYLAARILLAKHYAFLLLFLIMPASFLISGIDDSIKRKFPKFRIRYVLVALLFLSLVLLGLKTPFAPSSFYSPSEVSQMMSYKNSGIPQDALIVGDSRIYRGEIHWMFQGREYIESSYLAQLLSASQQTGKATPVDVYYVECAVDDCGWGTIKNQPDFNASMEQITSFFAANGNLVKEINSPGSYPLSSDSGTSYFRVYKTTLSIDTSLYSQLESQKVWFLYPIGYNESIAPIFDKYNIHSEADELIDYFAHWIVYLSIVLAFLAILASIYLFLELR